MVPSEPLSFSIEDQTFGSRFTRGIRTPSRFLRVGPSTTEFRRVSIWQSQKRQHHQTCLFKKTFRLFLLPRIWKAQMLTRRNSVVLGPTRRNREGVRIPRVK